MPGDDTPFPANRKDTLKHKDRVYFFSNHRQSSWVVLIIVKHIKSVGNKTQKSYL